MKTLLALTLITAPTWADVGHTYFCSMIKFTNMSHRGEITLLEPTTFKFTRRAEVVVFGKNGFNNSNSLDNKPFEITFSTDVNKEWFHAESFSHRFAYSDGRFHWTSAEAVGIRSFVAECEIFD